MISQIDPRTLVTPWRLDLVVKWRFFRHLQTGDDPDAERLYRWHIAARSGGVERGSWKQSVDDYVTAARTLLSAMTLEGFDSRCPVRVGNNGRLMDGAHRTACALALGIGPIPQRQVDKPGRARSWGRDWFEAYGLPAADLVRLDRDWKDLHADEARHLLHE